MTLVLREGLGREGCGKAPHSRGGEAGLHYAGIMELIAHFGSATPFLCGNPELLFQCSSQGFTGVHVKSFCV